MTDRQNQIIGECLRAASFGPFIPDWEFSILFGVEKQEIAEISAAWPTVDLTREAVLRAVNNSLGNLCGYPIDNPKSWDEYISVPREELEEIMRQWQSERLGLKGTEQ